MTDPAPNRRRFVRHSSDIPVEVSLEDTVVSKEQYLKNISYGGMCFRSKFFLDTGRIVHVRIPLLRPLFEAKGRVAWCSFRSTYFEVGVEFIEVKDIFKVRLAEQVCLIEKYREEVREKEGRELTGTEAAIEWITKFAKDFSDTDPGQ